MKKTVTLISLMALAASTANAKPLKVYILVGQSNMQGHANVRTVPYMGDDPKTRALHKKIVDTNGTPRIHENVRIVGFSEVGRPPRLEKKHGPLTMGYGANLTRDDVCGPELGFGTTMAEKLGERVLLIKTAWGGKSLNTDFRPPSAGAYELPKKTQELWDKHPNGAHGIPKMADRPKWRAAKNKVTGHYYRLMVEHVKGTLADIKAIYPEYNVGQGYELSGLVWFQAWNDMCDGATYPDSSLPGGYAEYTRLMACFIRDVRKDLNAPQMPVVIGVIGVDGDKAKGGIPNLRPAMAAPASMDEFRGTVAAVQTKDFWDYDMAALQGKKDKVEHRLRAGHVIGKDGWMEPSDKDLPGWEPIGVPEPKARVWRYLAVEPTSTRDVLDKKTKKRFRKITLPTALKDWYAPWFDDSKWQRGKAPIGKGTWKFRDFPQVKANSAWGDGEFLLMRTTFDTRGRKYDAYRITVLARQGFTVYLNGHKIHTYVWWKDEPFYRAIGLGNQHAKHLRRGKNLLAVYANCEYNRRTKEAFGTLDVMIQGITKKNLDYVNSREYKLKQAVKVCTEEEFRIIMGSSNWAFHYLGSAKMLSQIGEAFAESMLKLQKR